ncbi:LysE family translocator [Agromyces sp. H66]|uniref:LysE family translocator n=1 Tax=Agromyces sp. H66 TaxID=2529859 RepID=UPI0010AA1BD8|nr:LysE family translocator [Agromyces sp. H66]
MPVGTWLTFAAALLVALAVPGPDFVLVVQSATRSMRRGLATAAGIVAGLCLHAGLAVAGLTTLLASTPSALFLLQLVGAAVLLWFGISMLRATRTTPHPQPGTRSDRREFVRGFLTNATNPKALLFFAAILPQFIGAGDGSGTRTAVLAATVVLGSAIWWAGAVVFVRLLGLGRSPAAERVVTSIGGLTLIAIALLLAVLSIAERTVL